MSVKHLVPSYLGIVEMFHRISENCDLLWALEENLKVQLTQKDFTLNANFHGSLSKVCSDISDITKVIDPLNEPHADITTLRAIQNQHLTVYSFFIRDQVPPIPIW